MQKPAGYDEAKVNMGGGDKLETGGHVLEILKAQETTLKGYNVLEIYFDTHPSDKQPTFYKDKYDSDVEQFGKENSRYQGLFNLFLPMGDPEENTYKWANSRLKGFLTSVEESNAGYKFDWNVSSLRGKKVGGVFGEEEYEYSNEIRKAVRLRYFCSTESAPTQKIPKVKELKNKAPATSQTTYVAPPPKQAELPFEI